MERKDFETIIRENLDEEDIDNALSFARHAKKAAEFLDNTKEVHVVSHLDADGLTSAAIILSSLKRKGILYELSVVQNVEEEIIEKLNGINTEKVIFVDIGSGQLDLIVNNLKDKKALILDHHETDTDERPEWLTHVNPHDFSLNGSKGISGAGTTYVFSRMLSDDNTDLAALAIIGAIGDVQEHNGFLQMNRAILADAESSGRMSARRGLKIYGAQTKPLLKILAYNHDLDLEGITGSEQSALLFLQSLGIESFDDKGRLRKYIDLTDDERKNLISAMLIKRSHCDNPQDIIGYYYKLNNESRGTVFKDAREYATMLNACGRMDAASIGIGACMGDRLMKRRAAQVQQEYKREISFAIRWFKECVATGKNITVKEGYMIIDGREDIKASIIGTIASIASRMNEVKDGSLILSIATLENGDVKASLRVKGNSNGYDLREILHAVAEKSGAAAGGHINAAGALIPKNSIDSFIRNAEEYFSELPKNSKNEKASAS